MRRKIETVALMLCALLLGSSAAHAKVVSLGLLTEAVPEVDFQGLGSVGVGTLLMVLGYTARKGYRKLVDRKRD
jgi:hypothetical protein